VVAFLGAQPAQAAWAVINEFKSLAGHRFPHLGFADRTGHDPVSNDAVMNTPPVVLLTESFVHGSNLNKKNVVGFSSTINGRF
jgi:hypothetical protein